MFTPSRQCWSLLAAVLLILFLASACSRDEPSKQALVVRPVKTVQVGAFEHGMNRTFPGKVVANTTAELAFRVPGQIAKWPISEGQHMKEGSLVAQLDQRDYLAALNRAKSQLRGAVASRKEAEANFRRGEKLLASGVIAQAAFDEMKAKFDNTKSAESSLVQEVRKAQLNLDYTTLKAPFDGIVSAKYVSEHAHVQAQQPVVQFQDIDAIDIVIEIPEFIWGKIARARAEGQAVDRSVEAVFDAHPNRKYKVALKEYQTTANPETQTYSVRLTMPQPEDFTAYPGMTAKIRAELTTSEVEGFRVPARAVFGGDDGTKFVWLVDGDSTIRKIPVETGEMTGADIVVTKGLKGGEQVVTAGVHTVLEGQKVTIMANED